MIVSILNRVFFLLAIGLTLSECHSNRLIRGRVTSAPAGPSQDLDEVNQEGNRQLNRFLVGTCLSHQFLDGSGTCQECHPVCQTCSNGSSSTDCLTCDAGKTFASNGSGSVLGTCSCNGGTFLNATFSCEACDSTCKSCARNQQNDCTACESASPEFRKIGISNGVMFTCTCLETYFENPSKDCTPCSQPCKECVGTSNYCLTCMTRFYLDSSTHTCLPCHASCGECSGGLDTECTTCSVNMTKNLVSLKCECDPGFYLESPVTQICAACHYSCQTCFASGKHGCSTCKTNRNIQPDHSCPCVSKYFEDSLQSFTCSACDVSCAECSGSATLCSACSGNRELSNKACVCKIGFYETLPSSVYCGSCYGTCKTCVGPAANECSSCDNIASFREMDQLGGVALAVGSCVCAIGYYSNNGAVVCSKCHPTCKHCTGSNSANSCTACYDEKFYVPSTVTTTFSCKCSSNYYEDLVNFTCLQCHKYCKTCSGPLETNCLSCSTDIQHRIFQANECVCASSTYQLEDVGDCFPCDSSCLSCSGSSKFQCDSCDSAVSHRELTLPFRTCECALGFFEETLISGIVVTLKCSPCVSPCASCYESATKCLSCTLNDSELINGICTCIDGYFFDAVSNTCKKCNQACSSCISAGDQNCIRCSEKYVDSVLFAGGIPTGVLPITCVLNESFALSTVNLACDASCALGKCSQADPDICTVCNVNRVKDLLSQACVCIDGYFEQFSSRTCEKCHFTCKTCYGPSRFECAVCGDQSINQRYAISTVGANIKCECTVGFYEISGENSCAACSTSCLGCNGTSQNCISCSENQILNSGICECKAGYTYMPALGKCNKCHVSCFECIGPQADQCISCSSTTRILVEIAPLISALGYSGGNAIGMAISANVGTCECVVGYFDDNVNARCKPCSLQCLSCKGSSNQCTACYSHQHRELVSGNSCVCMSHYRESAISVSLQPFCAVCPYDCLDCDTTDTCKSCEVTRVLNVSSGRCVCLEQQFEREDRTCQQCDVSCQSCSGTSSQCTKCYSNVSLNQQSECVCDIGYFKQANGKCGECLLTCFECSNATTCDSCESSARMGLNSNSGLCECFYGYTLVYSEHARVYYCVMQPYQMTIEGSENSFQSFAKDIIPVLTQISQWLAVISVLLGRVQIGDSSIVLFFEVQLLLYCDIAKPWHLRTILSSFHEVTFSLLKSLNSLNFFEAVIQPVADAKNEARARAVSHSKQNGVTSLSNKYYEEFEISENLFVNAGGAITLGVVYGILFVGIKLILTWKRARLQVFENSETSIVRIAIFKEYLVYVFMSLSRILSVVLLFSASVSVHEGTGWNEVIGILMILLVFAGNIGLIQYCYKFFDSAVYQFQNLQAQVHRLRISHFETLLYVIPFFIQSMVKEGMHLIGWKLVFRCVALIPLMFHRLKDHQQIVRYLFGISQLLLLGIDSILGVIILSLRKDVLFIDTSQSISIFITIFDGFLIGFLSLIIAGVVVDLVVAIFKFIMSKHGYGLSIAQLHQQKDLFNDVKQITVKKREEVLVKGEISQPFQVFKFKSLRKMN